MVHAAAQRHKSDGCFLDAKEYQSVCLLIIAIVITVMGIAINELEKKVLFAEVKRKKENISHAVLQEKSKKLQAVLNGYKTEFKGFSIEDM